MRENNYESLMSVQFTNDKVPQFIEPKKSDKIPFVKYGETNNYPEFLLTLFNRSAKHNAILTSKQTYIKGQGFYFDQTNMDGESIVALQAFIDHPNPYESLDDIMGKTTLDNELFGGFYLHGIPSKSGKKFDLYHIDYSKIRSDEKNEKFYISDCWLNEDGSENTNIKADQYFVVEPYDETKKQKDWIFYYKSYRPGLNTYTLPEYIGAVPAIITDAEIANFHRAEIQNGFKGSKLIVFKNGVPSNEEIKSVEKRMKAKFAPTDKAGTFVIDFVDDPNMVPEILDLSAGDFADKYNALNKTIQEEIFVGHKITSPMLFGVRVEGQLGGRSELVDAYNLFQNTYVAPKQATQQQVFDYFAPVKGKLKIKPTEPIMPSFSESVLLQILTKDEMRQIIGRKPLDIKANLNTSIVDDLNALSPLVANKVLGTLTANEIREIVSKPAITGGETIPSATPAAFSKCEHFSSDDEVDYEVFSKYGEPIENFTSIKHKKFIYSKQDFISKLDEGVLDLIKKTPKISVEDLVKILKVDKTKIEKSIETLIGDGLINKDLKITTKGTNKDIPTFEDIFIRYRYILRPDAPALLPGGESRAFCDAMISNPRYFTREDIENISDELGQIYGIPNYDAFKRRGGWYHDPNKDVNLPFCRHIWNQELVKLK